MYFLTLLLIGIVLILIALLILWAWSNPVLALAPYNAWISSNRSQTVFFKEPEKIDIFPASGILEKNWQIIRDEGWALLQQLKKRGNILSNYSGLVPSEELSNWAGWDLVVLRFFGNDQEAHIAQCPWLKQFLTSYNTEIVSMIFALLAPGKKVATHQGPFKGILRYHLGLDIPSGNCQLIVNNIIYKWQNGDGVLFDETYPHSVHNLTEKPRLILMVDIRRPLLGVQNAANETLIKLIGSLPASQQQSLI
jgi:aspartyl/asparaginyl beta-hydroxylase (cupin superfamily)